MAAAAAMLAAAAAAGNVPSPDPAAVVSSDTVRFTVLSSGLIRVQTVSAKEPWDDRSTLHVVNRRLPVPKFTHTAGSVSTADVTVTAAADGNATATCGGDVFRWSWTPGSPPETGSTHDRFSSFITAAGMYLLDDTATARLDDAERPWLDHRTTAQTDFYFFCYGSDFHSGLKMLTSITGSAPLMPKPAYGVWWCQCCPQYTPESFNSEVLLEYKNRSLPLSMAVIDMDWHKPGWNHYTWNPDLFPDPPSFVNAIKSGNNSYGAPLKLLLNIHPGAYEITPGDEDNYAAFARAMGADPSAGGSFKCNLFNDTYADALITTMLEPTGMDYYWDDCAYCTWEIAGKSAPGQGSCGDNRSTDVDGNLWADHVFQSYKEAVKKVRGLTLNRMPGVSPSNVDLSLLTNPALTRSAGLAGHRYPAAWTGDVQGDFGTLQTHVRLFPNAAATLLYVYYSADLGGFHNTKPEEYVRWLQWGAFTPIFRTHGSSDNDKRIWKFSTYEYLADAMRLRDSIVPWVYTLAAATHRDSMPFLRPMWFDTPSLLPAGGNTTTCGPSKTAHDAGSGVRSPNHPGGLLVGSEGECCKVCDADRACTAWIFADGGGVPGGSCGSKTGKCNCWPMAEVTSLVPKAGRTFGGAVTAGMNQYMFGQAVVNPITEAVDAGTKTVGVTTWLPDGDWVRWDGSGGWTGPTNVTENFGIGSIPIYLPVGSMVPLKQPRDDGVWPDPVVWAVVPKPNKADFTGSGVLYDDDGESLAYRSSGGATTRAHASSKSGLLVFNFSAVEGSFPGMPTNRGHWLQLRSPPAAIHSVACGGVVVPGPLDKPATLGWWHCGGGKAAAASLSCPAGSMTVACPGQDVHAHDNWIGVDAR
eukprot:TRINITY_DN1482_c0_g1_i2.p1 TRINITY_DN1482_c0_g1~~TRINITY_DN1482_c0_g1_i2.p1  ORF type:complete len:865 (+),score=254.11 TRINITY_DN1482_c0_g1_i2:79-2673(+)